MISVSELPAGDEGLRARWLSSLNLGLSWGWGGAPSGVGCDVAGAVSWGSCVCGWMAASA
ncbi:hypothetical protein [Xanthomonas axonopodis]|uniref:hypothetical protein n=1 Tax=Xanthomonas axonopodis TaxID=53413 RepID=UPI0014320AC5|nr:hypothetical protein [Xanthomonas axonopodis]